MNTPFCLFETLRPNLPLSEYHRNRIRIIDHHDYSGVLRKVREDLVKLGQMREQEWYDEGLLSLKQYYAIALLDGMNMHAVSNNVDPFWHAHILHTKQYVKFCDDAVGGYMHHDPLNHADTVAVEHVESLYHFTRDRYEEVFSWISERFNPRTLLRNELICVHFGVTYEAAQHALFAPHPSAQPLVRH